MECNASNPTLLTAVKKVLVSRTVFISEFSFTTSLLEIERRESLINHHCNDCQSVIAHPCKSGTCKASTYTTYKVDVLKNLFPSVAF